MLNDVLRCGRDGTANIRRAADKPATTPQGYAASVALASDDPKDAQGLDAAELRSAGLGCDEITRSSGGARPAPWKTHELRAWAAASPTRLLRLQRLRERESNLSSERESKQGASGGDTTTTTTPAAWPETVVLHATDDKTVPVRSAREFVAALEVAPAKPALLRYDECAGS